MERRKIRNSLGLTPQIPRWKPSTQLKEQEQEQINSLSSFSYGSSSSGDVRINIKEPEDSGKKKVSSGLIKLRQMMPAVRAKYREEIIG